VEQIHPRQWHSILGVGDEHVQHGAWARRLGVLARWAGVWPRARRPPLGSVSDSWLREFDAEASKHGANQ
jgi:hypothetical protein